MKTLIALLLAAAMLVAAAPLADLLEQGIYTQETLGDLDKAIQIYQQVADQAGESRTYGAQALYRLILCYGRKETARRSRGGARSTHRELSGGEGTHRAG